MITPSAPPCLMEGAIWTWARAAQDVWSGVVEQITDEHDRIIVSLRDPMPRRRSTPTTLEALRDGLDISVLEERHYAVFALRDIIRRTLEVRLPRRMRMAAMMDFVDHELVFHDEHYFIFCVPPPDDN